MTGVFVAAAIIAVPALAFTLWPLVRRTATRGLLPVPPDPREQLMEEKRAALRALRELEFEHASGHVSNDDYADLRARYEGETAAILTALDRLAVPPPTVTARETAESAPGADASARGAGASARRSVWLHPAALAISGVVLLVFGIVIGVGIVRFSAPDQSADMPPPGSRPLADLSPPQAPRAPVVGVPGTSGTMPPAVSADTGGAREILPEGRTLPPEGRKIPPEVMKGMLDAARQALFSGQYGQAISAYQAVLKRDPQNVDAMTHLGLIVAIGGHADTALETLGKALAIDPNYPPALFYRGQVLYEAKKDVPGAIRSWEKFMTVAPLGEDRDRVAQLITEAKKRKGGK